MVSRTARLFPLVGRFGIIFCLFFLLTHRLLKQQKVKISDPKKTTTTCVTSKYFPNKSILPPMFCCRKKSNFHQPFNQPPPAVRQHTWSWITPLDHSRDHLRTLRSNRRVVLPQAWQVWTRKEMYHLRPEIRHFRWSFGETSHEKKNPAGYSSISHDGSMGLVYLRLFAYI